MRVLSWLPVVGLYGGLLLEAVADHQKSRYRDDKRNDGHWCDVGLFSLSRHPNYFAELLVWWSVYFCCMPALSLPLSLVGLVSPFFSSFIILKLSGVPLLEKKNLQQYGADKGYQAYVQNTYQLVPFPKSLSSSGTPGGEKKKK
jgi:steroid 5-alpha reductase family enzyme